MALLPSGAWAIGGVPPAVGPPQPLGPLNPTWSEPTPGSAPAPVPEGEEAAVAAPDGHSYTRATFPAPLFRRPLVLPRGLAELSVNVNGALDSAGTLGITLGGAVGLGADTDLTVLGDVIRDTAIALVGYHQFTRNVALSLHGSSLIDGGSPTHPSNVAAGLGLPLKVRVPWWPVALRALGTVATWSSWYWPELEDFAGGAHTGVRTDHVVLAAPVSLELSPLGWLSCVLGASASVGLGGTSTASNGARWTYGPTENVGASVNVIFTGVHADLGFGVGVVASFTSSWASRPRGGVTMTFRP